MAFVCLTDGYGSIDSVIFFPEAYRTYKHILFDNNIIIVKGKKGHGDDSFIVEKCFIPRT